MIEEDKISPEIEAFLLGLFSDRMDGGRQLSKTNYGYAWFLCNDAIRCPLHPLPKFISQNSGSVLMLYKFKDYRDFFGLVDGESGRLGIHFGKHEYGIKPLILISYDSTRMIYQISLCKNTDLTDICILMSCISKVAIKKEIRDLFKHYWGTIYKENVETKNFERTAEKGHHFGFGDENLDENIDMDDDYMDYSCVSQEDINNLLSKHWNVSDDCLTDYTFFSIERKKIKPIYDDPKFGLMY